ncbi:MAG TPA: 3-deoxy-D-manno-octulosonic acid transferase [Pyrinomonadaceae bacterium]|nr:3-deoxy-D-manno-octulosonic acid transferase [Pyrinomonadaceae bacterium]
MYFFYSLLLTLGFVALLPRFAIDALRSGKYVTGLRQRLGKLPAINRTGEQIIWLHCVSVGETQAAQSLVRALRIEFPKHCLAVSTTTVTGQQLARKLFANDAALVFYFPIDLAWVVRRVLRILQPSAVLIMETELWPRLLHECRARTIPVALLNGRISETSFRRYKLIRPFIRRMLNDLTVALMQSEKDAARIRELGLPGERIALPGNLKFDSAETAIDERVTAELRRRFGFDGTRPLIVAASTHTPEERITIEALKQMNSDQRGRTRLLIAPRRPERFGAVASLLEDSGLSWSRRSAEPGEPDKSCDVVLLDTVGELRAVYPLAQIVFVGGSIGTHGGHNMLEPAATGACVITGPHTENFAAITKALLDEGALIQLPEGSASDAPTQLVSVFKELLSDEARRREMGLHAREVCKQNAGATARTMRMLSPILSQTTIADPASPLSTLSVTATK